VPAVWHAGVTLFQSDALLKRAYSETRLTQPTIRLARRGIWGASSTYQLDGPAYYLAP